MVGLSRFSRATRFVHWHTITAITFLSIESLGLTQGLRDNGRSSEGRSKTCFDYAELTTNRVPSCLHEWPRCEGRRRSQSWRTKTVSTQKQTFFKRRKTKAFGHKISKWWRIKRQIVLSNESKLSFSICLLCPKISAEDMLSLGRTCAKSWPKV